ncbi:endonuclease/exonuclease/phosphatase family protein [Aureimonas sp. ME7]|uniref:endonuclease/exonuclease/phosphatase family protein n=1 Tax=Aureimonas sp. ME7 TaxID=2744252 RepID=UPI0015F3B323|nr:endonuclease/exonuclease/phosphatase family protein [Aureimonas sp. ME7]
MATSTANRTWVRVGLRVLVLGASLAIGLGFLGAWVLAFDSVAQFRVHLAVLLLLAAPIVVWMRLRASAAFAVLIAALGIGSAAPFFLAEKADPSASGAVYTLLQMNVLWKASDPTEAIRRIADARPDIVTLEEITPEWQAALSSLDTTYPFRVFCQDADGFHGDSAILSRRPFVAGTGTHCDSRNSLALARVDLNGTPVTVAAHHQLWPWPGEQWQRFERIRETLGVLPEPVLLAGDFNSVPWSAFLSAYAEATRTRVVPGIGPTWFPEQVSAEWGRYFGLGIDNVLASPAISIVRTERLKATSSDHLPVLVHFRVAPSQPEAPQPEAPSVDVAGG